MSLITLPGNDGSLFGVNPHTVSSVQAHRGPLAGVPGVHDLSVVWMNRVEGGTATTLHISALPVESTLNILNGARKAEAAAFEAGFLAAIASRGRVRKPTTEEISTAFLWWKDNGDTYPGAPAAEPE